MLFSGCSYTVLFVSHWSFPRGFSALSVKKRAGNIGPNKSRLFLPELEERRIKRDCSLSLYQLKERNVINRKEEISAISFLTFAIIRMSFRNVFVLGRKGKFYKQAEALHVSLAFRTLLGIVPVVKVKGKEKKEALGSDWGQPQKSPFSERSLCKASAAAVLFSSWMKRWPSARHYY